MRIQSFLSRISVLSASLVMGVSAVSAQSYYDDDIYYDASKAPKKTEKIDKARRDSKSAVRGDASRQSQQSSQYYYDGAAYVPWNNVGDYQSADSYRVDGTSTRDVDEYNRRYTGSQASSSQCDSISLEQFEEMSNTKNLARFHDSSAAREAYADDVDESAAYSNDAYTYSAQPQTTLNINVVGGYPYYPYYGYSSPWYWNSWGYYDPWWGWSGPSWSWGWGPSFAWGSSWGWVPSWSWGPSLGWGPSWGVSSRPHYTSPGAYAPNRTHASSGTYRGNSYRNGAGAGSPSTIGNSLGRRPSGSQGSNRNGVTQSARPGYREPIGRPNTSGTVNGASSGSQRGRAGYESRQSGINNNNSSTRYNSNTYRNNSNSNNSNSWNSNSSRGRNGSFGGSSSGSSRGGFSGGGVSRGSSGGGGHRGR